MKTEEGRTNADRAHCNRAGIQRCRDLFTERSVPPGTDSRKRGASEAAEKKQKKMVGRFVKFIYNVIRWTKTAPFNMRL